MERTPSGIAALAWAAVELHVLVHLTGVQIADRAVDAPGVLHNTYYTELNPAARGRQRGVEPLMNLGWILLGLVGWALGLVVVLALFRMSGDQDRAARHEQKRLDPYSDVTITRSGEA